LFFISMNCHISFYLIHLIWSAPHEILTSTARRMLRSLTFMCVRTFCAMFGYWCGGYVHGVNEFLDYDDAIPHVSCPEMVIIFMQLCQRVSNVLVGALMNTISALLGIHCTILPQSAYS
jgi:hypothetical protein